MAAALRDPGNALFLSIASVWEMAIKSAKGAFFPGLDQPDVALRATGVALLPITIPQALAAGALPRVRGDPFDRMLVAQAQVEGMILVTEDGILGHYGGPLFHRP